MKPGNHQDLERWLAEERDGATEAAEAALGALFSSVARLAPRPGFADRVVAAVRGGGRAWRWWWVRGAVAATLLAGGLAVAVFPLGEIPSLVGAWSVSILSLGVAACIRLMSWLEHGLVVWRALAQIGSAAGLALVTGPALAVLTANGAVAVALAFALNRLLSREEEWSRC